MNKPNSPEELVHTIVRLLDGKKAEDITAIQIKELTTIGDYFVVASGNSSTQVKAMANEVEDKLSAMGIEPRRVEGHQTCLWILLDYRDVIVHIFNHVTREFYGIERLWSDAPRMDISHLLTQN